MEKRQLIQSLLCLFFLIPFIGYGFSSGLLPDDELNNGKIVDIDSKQLQIGEDSCRGAITFRVKVAHLSSESPGLPSGVEDMYVHYQFGSTLGNEQLTEFEYGGTVLVAGGYFVPIYYHEVVVPVEIFDECFDDQDIDFTIVLRDVNGNYYPIQNYDAEQEIFTCQYFIKTCNEFCTGNCTHEAGTSPIWSGSIPIKSDFCDECTSPTPGNLNGSEGGTSFFSQITPNPFNSTAKLELNIDDSADLEVIIYDASGRVVSSWEDYAYKGNYNQEMNTSDWQNGIYYGIVKVGDQVERFRMVKIE